MTTFRAGGVTDTGQARAVNQDSLLVLEGRLYAVADGMGGHRGGEVASALALESLAGDLGEASTAALVAGVTRANHTVYTRSSQDPELRGMGTTLVALALVLDADGGERLAMANVGDSRAYRIRAGQLEQMTEDHSLVESLVRQGRITAEEAATHPQRNSIRLQLRQNQLLQRLSSGQWAELEPLLLVADYRKSDPLARVMQVGTRPVKTSKVAAAAKRQLALMREIMTQVPLTPEARKRLAESRSVFVPIGR